VLTETPVMQKIVLLNLILVVPNIYCQQTNTGSCQRFIGQAMQRNIHISRNGSKNASISRIDVTTFFIDFDEGMHLNRLQLSDNIILKP
jgi:hypothetical protein